MRITRAVKILRSLGRKGEKKRKPKPNPTWGKWVVVCSLPDLKPRRYKNCGEVKI